jgi:hypothetical protein
MSHRVDEPCWRTAYAFAAVLIVVATSGMQLAHETGFMAPAQPAEAGPLVGPVLLLYLTPASVEIRPVENAARLQFTGTVEVQQPVVMRSDVELSASCYWPAQVEPDTLEFQGSYKQTFTVIVVVPAGTLPKQREFLEVTGSLKTPGLPLETANATAAIYIADYPLLVVQYDVMETQFKAGKTRDIKLVVENKASEDLDLEITSGGDPGTPQATLRDGTETIPAKEWANVTVRVTVPKEAEGGAQVLHLRLTATTQDGGYEYKMMLNVPCDVDASITSAINKRGVLYMVVFIIAAVVAFILLIVGTVRGRRWVKRWRAARRAAREAGQG